eukprot:PRCOL_00006082-RA
MPFAALATSRVATSARVMHKATKHHKKTRPKKLTPSDRNRTPPVFPDVYADAPTQIVFDAPTTKVTEITDVAVPAAAE